MGYELAGTRLCPAGEARTAGAGMDSGESYFASLVNASDYGSVSQELYVRAMRILTETTHT
jgi:hypothetical protein